MVLSGVVGGCLFQCGMSPHCLDTRQLIFGSSLDSRTLNQWNTVPFRPAYIVSIIACSRCSGSRRMTGILCLGATL
jgi:hypothetical protein